MKEYKSIYFVGAGGIGMAALERYCLSKGKNVAGYDRTPTALTEALEKEGVNISFSDDVATIPDFCRDKQDTLVVYTPAIPDTNAILSYFRDNGFEVVKRARLLGLVTRDSRGLCFSGTHGKTTTSSMAAHIMHQSPLGCNAFLGGVLRNYDSNFILDTHSQYSVIEADEFDRSFHHLRPFATVVTATDADHLDIYGTEEAYLESFNHYTSLIQPGGALIAHRGLRMTPRLQEGVKLYDYARTEGDFHAENIRIGGGRIVFDFISPLGHISDVELGVPVSINIENGIAAMALAQLAGAEADEIRRAMASFGGVDRRFDFKLKTDRIVFLSDYAHHPAEIRQSILSLKEVFDNRRIAAIFQPHLYTRTRDFYKDFADSLSLLDEVILTEIYPARELPIEGVTSQIIYDELRPDMKRRLCHKADVPAIVESGDWDVLVVLGAGDLDNYCDQIADILKKKYC